MKEVKVRTFGSQEKMAEYFNSRPRKIQGRESDICKICHLLRRAGQLRNELSVINKQLNETYGIALSDVFLSQHSEFRSSRTPHPGGIGGYYFCSQRGRKSNAQENVSPGLREASSCYDCPDVMGQL